MKPDIRTLCRQVLSEKCSDHRKGPFVEVITGKLKITACCSRFRLTLEKLIGDEHVYKPEESDDLINNKRALIIDDEIDFCLLIRFYLSKKDYEVGICHDVQTATGMIKDHNPGWIIVDEKLFDKLEVLHHTKARVTIIGTHTHPPDVFWRL